jgi:hypothetical protein
MTAPQPINAHSSALLMALHRAGEDGLTEAEVVAAAGRWWRNRISELCRAGYAIGERDSVFFLVGVGRAASTRVDGGLSEQPASGPSSPAQLTLDVGTGSSHYREAA